MSIDDWRAWWDDVRENWQDAYWRADHPEVVAVAIAIATGVLGVLFAWLQALVQRRVLDG